jgi:hypothetical protein
LSSHPNCPYCSRPLIEINYFRERLIGCIECNRWGRRGDKRLVMELRQDDLEALRDYRRRHDLPRQQA